MRKNKKISVSSKFAKSLLPSQGTNDTNVSNISLKVDIIFPSVVNSFDFVSCLNNLTGSLLKTRKKELIQFVEYIRKSPHSPDSRKKECSRFKLYVNTVIESGCEHAFTSKESIEIYKQMLNQKLLNGKLTQGTINDYRKTFGTLFKRCYGLDTKIFNQSFPKNKNRKGTLNAPRINDLNNNSKCYTKKDLKLLLKTLLAMSQYYQDKYLAEEDIFELSKNPFVMEYDKGTFAPVHHADTVENPISQVINIAGICLIYALMGFSGANQATLLRVKRKDVTIEFGERDLITLTLKCYRKKKAIIDEHSFRKYQLRFFNAILEYSKIADPNENALFFPCLHDNGVITEHNPSSLNNFSSLFKGQKMLGEHNEIICPLARKLRNTYGEEFPDIESKSSALGNSEKVAERHYSDGNITENNNILQKGMDIYTLSLLSNGDIEQVKSEYSSDIDIKIIEDKDVLKELAVNKKAIKTPDGGVCLNSLTSTEAIKYQQKVKRMNLTDNNDVHCANILACFHCDKHLFVNSDDGIYMLLSFEKYLHESHYAHESGGLFGDRSVINKTLVAIAHIITKFESSMVSTARLKIQMQGVHPLWDMEELS